MLAGVCRSGKSCGLPVRSLPGKLPAALRPACPATPSGHNKAVAIVAMFVSCDGQHLLEADPSSTSIRPFLDLCGQDNSRSLMTHDSVLLPDRNTPGQLPAAYCPAVPSLRKQAADGLVQSEHAQERLNELQIITVFALLMPDM